MFHAEFLMKLSVENSGKIQPDTTLCRVGTLYAGRICSLWYHEV